MERICHGGSKLTPVKVCIAATARMGNREGANGSLHGDLANRWIWDYRKSKETENTGG